MSHQIETPSTPTPNKFEGMSPAEIIAMAAEMKAALANAEAAVLAAKREAVASQLKALNDVLAEEASEIFLDPSYRPSLHFVAALPEVITVSEGGVAVVTQEAQKAQWVITVSPVGQPVAKAPTRRTSAATQSEVPTADGVAYRSYRAAWDTLAALPENIAAGWVTPNSSFNARARLMAHGVVCGGATR